MGGQREREDCLARNIHSRLGRQHKLRLQGRGKLFLSSAPFPSPVCRLRLFCLTILLPPCCHPGPTRVSSTQQLPCNSVPQCQVMQPGISFLSISQYIHNSSSGRYNGFRETLDRGNTIMCSPQPTSTMSVITSIGWLAFLALRLGVT